MSAVKCCVLSAFVAGSVAVSAVAAPVYRSAIDVAWSPDGKLLAVSDHTAGALVFVDPGTGKIVREVKLAGKPSCVSWSAGGDSVFVAEYGAGTVAEVKASGGSVVRRLKMGVYPFGVAVAPKRGLVLATDKGLGQVVVFDVASGAEKARIEVVCLPHEVVVTPDEKLALVGNRVPYGDARKNDHAAEVTLVDLETMKKAADIKLPPGSVNVLGIAVSPDGRWAYVVHNVGRFTLPTTQLERGWINTNGLTILDLAGRRVHATFLLDQLSLGAADPWGAALSPDGGTLWVTLAGAQQLARVNVATLHQLLDGRVSDPGFLKANPRFQTGFVPNAWKNMSATNDAARAGLVNDLAALYTAGLIERRDFPANGPRGVAVSPDGSKVAVAAYFAGEVVLCDAADAANMARVAIGTQPPADAARAGETIFFDATYCFQKWLSCGTCHPDTRADGLNWDLLNDGLGNPKNTRSMVWSDRTPPAMWLGVRDSMEMATEKGFVFIQFRTMESNDVDKVRAYLRSLEPEPSPYRVNGQFSAKAESGRKLFEDKKVGCVHCHPGPLFTDLKMYDVGTGGSLDRDETAFDTPTCVELWRTPPYLHDGSSPTLEHMLTVGNKNGKHGATSHLTKEQIEALAEYLRSL